MMKKAMRNREVRREGISRSAAMLAALSLTVALAGCDTAEADAMDDASAGEAIVRVINVETSTVSTNEFVEDIRLTAAVMANQDVSVAAQESGVIRELWTPSLESTTNCSPRRSTRRAHKPNSPRKRGSAASGSGRKTRSAPSWHTSRRGSPRNRRPRT